MEAVAKPKGQSMYWTKRISLGNEAGSENFWDDQSAKTPLIDKRRSSPSQNSRFPWKRAKLVEPLAAIYMVSVGILFPVSEQYVYLRISETFGNNNTNTSENDELSQLCNVNKSSPVFEIQQKTQNATSQFLMYLNVIQALICAIPTIVAGNLVDRFGRKIALYLSFGSRLFYAGVLVVVIAFDLPLNVLYAGAALDGISGSYSTAMMAFSTYISDVTLTRNDRGFRMTVMESVMGLTAGLSILGTGLLIQYTNFLIPSLICLASIILGLIYIKCVLAESYEPSKEPVKVKRQSNTWKRSFTIYFTDVPEKRRSRLVLGLIGLFFTVPSSTASGGVVMLYLLNLPFCWTSENIGIFFAILTVVRCFCSILLVKLMQGYLSDIGLSILGNVSNCIYCIGMALATNNTLIYIASSLGIFASAAIPNIRSAMSKLVKQEEHGPLFASISFMEMISTTIFVIVFNMVYSMTLSIMPGIVFFFLAGIMMIALISLVAYEIIGRKRISSKPPDRT